jgi:protein-tyrosine-phosphatase
MAAAIMRQRIAEMGLGGQIRVTSAGVWAGTGHPASEDAAAVLAGRGIQLSNHRSQPLTQEMLGEADVVLVMEESHRRSIFHLAPKYLPRVLLITELSGAHDDIEDPYGGPIEGYVNTEARLEALIDAGLPRLLQLLDISSPLRIPPDER